MKYIGFFLILLGAFVLFQRMAPQQPLVDAPSPSPLFQPQGTIVSLKDREFRINLQHVTTTKNLTLIPNFTESKTSYSLLQDNDCLYGANAGFYTQERKPLGVFHVNDYSQRQPHTEQLFNGFVSKDQDGTLTIQRGSSSPFNADAEFVFQSGPYFTPQSILRLLNDELARRIVIGKTDADQFYLLAFTEKDNTNSGPYLIDLPELVNKLNQVSTPTFTELVNLDGGSASAFYSKTGVRLEEITPIGSFLCGK